VEDLCAVNATAAAASAMMNMLEQFTINRLTRLS
jgi:hypothetical protein